MTPHDLIQAFDILAEAPDGVARLRELVLQLAVQGKLVPQDPEDEPASIFLVSRTLGDQELDLPAGWAWTTISRLGAVLGGGTPSKNNPGFWGGGIPWVSPKDMKQDYITGSRDQITQAAIEGSSVKLVPRGALLMVVRGMILAHSFPTALTELDVTVNQDMKALLPFRSDLAPYLLMLTKGLKPQVLGLVEHSTHGTCKLPTARLLELPIPLPPLAEQHRIVKKVDALMGLLDRLESARAARDLTRCALRDAALAALRDADSPDEVEEAWGRISENLHELFTEPADVEPLRQAVLQLAVRGRLVRQEAGDEPASVLLERIGAEKARLVREGKIRAGKELAPIGDGEVPFEVPSGWVWTRLVTACDVRDGTHDTPKYVETGVPLVTSKNLSSGRLDIGTAKLISWLDHEEISKRSAVDVGDILFAMIGSIGNPVLVDVAEPFSIKNVALFKPFLKRQPDFDYLLTYLESVAVKMCDDATGGVQKFVSLGALRSYPIPFPPLAEQHRIVAKTRELMSVLDRLVERLESQRTAHRAFAAAAVHHLDA